MVGRQALLYDVAVLLAVLLRVSAQPLHGRWLSLSVLRDINAHLHLPEPLEAAHSELQTRRLRWLHYLAQAAGLISLQNGAFKPTLAAWHWLDAPPQVQWDSLMQAVERDLEARERLWDVFRFPAITAQTWRVVRHTLDDLSPADAYRVKDVFVLFKPYLLPDKTADVAYLLRDMFAWSGVLLLRHGRMYCYSRTFTGTKTTHGLPITPETWRLPLPQLPSAALVMLLSFAQIHADTALIHAQSIAAAVRQGLSAADIVRILNALLETPLTKTAQRQIQTWVQAANQLTLKPIVILHAPDAALLKQIRSDWRLAGHFAERLSPNHLAVIAEDAPTLLHRLERRRISVTSLLAPKSDRRITNTPNSDMAYTLREKYGYAIDLRQRILRRGFLVLREDLR